MPLTLRPDSLTIDAVVAVARSGEKVKLSPASIAAMKRSRAVVETALTDGLPHYGINTGFGSLSKQRIGHNDLAALQRKASVVQPPSPGLVARLTPSLPLRRFAVCFSV